MRALEGVFSKLYSQQQGGEEGELRAARGGQSGSGGGDPPKTHAERREPTRQPCGASFRRRAGRLSGRRAAVASAGAEPFLPGTRDVAQL
jgi:hypothetical protein